MSNNTKFCADCGDQLNIKAEICPKCGVRQKVKKGKNPVIIILLVVVVGFGSLAVIGILSAIAIPQFSSYRMKGYNSSALSDLRNAKTSIETYYADNQKYPESLDATGFKKAIGVDIAYKKTNGKQYVIVSVHEKGTKLYQSTSEDPKIYQRDSSNENAQFTEL